MKRLLVALIFLLLPTFVDAQPSYYPPSSSGGGGAAVGDHTCAANTWMSSIASEVFTCTQPAFTNISGTPTTAQGSAASRVRPCEIVIGSRTSTASAIPNDADTPVVCSNKTGETLTITAVECYADAGTPTVTPIITGGAATSILTGALTCGTGSFATGTLNGTPTQSNNGTIDANVTTAGGTAKYIVIRITRTL